MSAVARDVLFERMLDPFLPPEEAADEYDNDNEYAFHRRVFLGKELKPSRYSGYFMQSNTLGFVPLGDHNLPSKKRKLWYGNTNFRLTVKDRDVVCAVDGVAGFVPVSPYRFLVDVAWMFPEDEVLGTIRGRLCEAPPSQQDKGKVANAADPLVRSAWMYKAWAIVQVGNRRELVTGLTREEVEGKLRVRGEAPVKTSWEVPDGQK